MILLPVLLSSDVFGQETKKWSDTAEFSYVDTGGNTDVQTALLNNMLKYAPDEFFTVAWTINMLSGETDGEKTAERYATALRTDYTLSPAYYVFGELSWMKDRFAGIEDRYRANVGVGYKILKGSTHKLDVEAGLNYNVEDYTDETDADYPGGRLFSKYEYHFTRKNYFAQWVEYLHDFDDPDNYRTNAETSLISSLNGFLSLKASYLIERDNVPVAGTKKTDTKLAMTLVANF